MKYKVHKKHVRHKKNAEKGDEEEITREEIVQKGTFVQTCEICIKETTWILVELVCLYDFANTPDGVHERSTVQLQR